MTDKYTILLLFFTLTFSSFAQDYTIPKKHRVIQESTIHSDKIEIGTKLDGISFTSVTDDTFQLDSLVKQGPVIFVFLSTECPVAQRYAMRLKRMHTEYLEKQVSLIGVYSNENDSIDDVKNYLIKAEYTFPIIKDSDGNLARHLSATMTPQAHLIDTSGLLRYRGAIDDNRYVTRVKHEYLIEALNAVIEGNRVLIDETPAFGCTIHLPEVVEVNPVTYITHIAPLLEEKCQNCHHQYGIAPFAFDDYIKVKSSATKILRSINSGIMPPTRLNPEYGDFVNSQLLTDYEVGLISSWVQAGTPKGEVDDTSKKLIKEEWSHGEPDILNEIPFLMKELTVGEQDTIVFRVNTGIKTDHYIRGIDFKTTNPKAVRRIVAGFEITDRSNQSSTFVPLADNKKDISSDFDVRIGTWSHGFIPNILPDGVGFLLTKGSDIILKVLLNGTGKEEHISLKLGIYVSKKQETAKLQTISLKSESQTPLEQEITMNSDVFVFSIQLPMNVDEHDIKIIGVTPKKEQINLAWIKKSDIDWLDDWLDIYHYVNPVFLPKGTRLEYIVEENFRENLDPMNTKFYYVLASEFVDK
ncbi:redoxin domain-containing protein [Candidatus Poribacteria bacterium]|nr:redoxin domain-containing protein [Candidatus Poribacteria bacterium]